MLQSTNLILEDVKSYANENMSNYIIIRLHRACCLISEISKRGQINISQYITNQLLNTSKLAFK